MSHPGSALAITHLARLGSSSPHDKAHAPPNHLQCPPCLSFPTIRKAAASPASQHAMPITPCNAQPSVREGSVSPELSPVCSRWDGGQAALRGRLSHRELGAAPAARAGMGFPLLSFSSWPLIRSARYLPAISLPAALCPGSNHRVNE